MAGLDRLLQQYEMAIRSLGDELLADRRVSPIEREYLKLLNHLLLNTVHGYAAYHLRSGPELDSNTSVMYAASDPAQRSGPLNVPLRSLVEYNTLSSWQARYLNGCLAMKRTIVFTGSRGTGKSTLLNALIQLIPVDQRIVAVEEQQLASLRDRAFSVRLGAENSDSGAKAIAKAGTMLPTWLLVDGLGAADAGLFFSTVDGPIAGLATIEEADPEALVKDWISTETELGDRLSRISPLFVPMSCDPAGRPRAMTLLEVEKEGDELRLVEKKP